MTKSALFTLGGAAPKTTRTHETTKTATAAKVQNTRHKLRSSKQQPDLTSPRVVVTATSTGKSNDKAGKQAADKHTHRTGKITPFEESLMRLQIVQQQTFDEAAQRMNLTPAAQRKK